ncbi:TOBE domain-containing protein [Streptomyces enissocaesilis]|uniref:TOBE domain-containing protein n=1 Tax=Streptomyces enissocaesilis TaxID=332589 RepID=UPI003CD08B10
MAGFVGEPAINLLPGAAGADGRVRLPEGVRPAVPVRLAAGREVVPGVRPEDLRLAGEGAAEAVRARAGAREPLLEAGIATLALDGVAGPLVVQTGPGVRLDRDETVRVSADPRPTHVFDAETGEACDEDPGSR